jgi:hypothetical protein
VEEEIRAVTAEVLGCELQDLGVTLVALGEVGHPTEQRFVPSQLGVEIDGMLGRIEAFIDASEPQVSNGERQPLARTAIVFITLLEGEHGGFGAPLGQGDHALDVSSLTRRTLRFDGPAFGPGTSRIRFGPERRLARSVSPAFRLFFRGAFASEDDPHD